MATSVKLNKDWKTRVQDLAGLRKRSPHWIMHEAIVQYVVHEEAKESFKQEAIASWTAYQETGLHITGKELQAWLSTWGTEAEMGPPQCHE